MTEVNIRYNPYRLTTVLTINGNGIADDSTIFQTIDGKRLQSWIGNFPEMLKDERGDRSFEVFFHGNTLDYDDVKDAFEQAKKKNILDEYTLHFDEAMGDDEVFSKIQQTYNDLMADPEYTYALSQSDREGLNIVIQKVMSNVFPIHVIATMSSGKSTLINALLSQKLMPSKNEACTAIITEILDNNNPEYTAVVYDISDNRIKTVDQLTYDVMNELNSNPDTARVAVEGNIPFIKGECETRLKLVDTPGPNNSRDSNHRETTYKNINSATENMILYVLNYTQLATNDDENLLNYVAEEIRKGGKETRDRFIFVLNKMDEVKSEDSVSGAIEITRNYLIKHGIDDPQIFPCSAYAALGLRTLLKDIDPYDSVAVEDAVEKYDNDDISDMATLVRKLNRKEELHLEQYSTLTPSENEKLHNRLAIAEKNKDRSTTALIHSGICSIESAIMAYVHKYAKAKKIRSFFDPLEKQLMQSQKDMESKLQAMSGGAEAEEIKKRSAAINEMIGQGQEAKKFKAKIAAIDPLPKILQIAKEKSDKVQRALAGNFKFVGDKIEGRSAAINFVNHFADDASEKLSSLTADLEVLVEQEVNATCTRLVSEYQKKLDSFDDSIGSSLNFNTSDLVQGVLSRIQDLSSDYSSDGKISSQFESEIDNIHIDEIEETTVDVIKMKEVRKKIQDGVEKVQTGEERVVVGTHREKVGTTTVKKKRKGILGLLGFQKDVEEDVYTDFEDVEYRPTYAYVPKMKEIIEEVPTIEQETRTNTKYVVMTSELQRKLINPLQQQLSDGLNGLKEAVTENITSLKEQFMASFDEIDKVIQKKYAELESCMNEQDELDKRKRECQETLDFINENLNELREAIDV